MKMFEDVRTVVELSRPGSRRFSLPTYYPELRWLEAVGGAFVVKFPSDATLLVMPVMMAARFTVLACDNVARGSDNLVLFAI